MKKTKFQRITALVLALVFLLCGGVVTISANDSDELSDEMLEIQELLNMISYSEYITENDSVDRATEDVVIDATKNWVYVDSQGNAPAEGADAAKVETYGEKEGLYVPSTGTVTWSFEGISTAARYNVEIEYYPVENKAASIERIFMINGKVPFTEARYMTLSKIWNNVYPDGMFELGKEDVASDYLAAAEAAGIVAKEITKDGKSYIQYEMPDYWTEKTAALVDELVLRFFASDIDANEIRTSLVEDPVWTTYSFKDSNGFYQNPFEFVVGPAEDGTLSISMESVNEPIAISEIRLVVPEDSISYEDYLSKHEGKAAGTETIKIEGEYFSAASSQTIYPISDSTSAITSPASTDHTVLNTVGGDKWQTAGQWIEYSFSVGSSGMYTIAPRFKQAVLEGMYTSRMLYLYSDATVGEGEDGYYNGLPFDEAGRLKFSYSSDWQSTVLGDEEEAYQFYFKEGVVYTMRLEVSLGNMGDIVRRVQASLDSINNDYLNILKLTGSTPDEFRDYGFSRVMPDTMVDMIIQSEVLAGGAKENWEGGIVGELNAASGIKASSMTATLQKVARLLDQMGKDDDEVAKNLEQLKTYIGSLGTWLSDAKTQPLTIDYINVQPVDAELPKAKANFWQAMSYEVVSFVKSFFRNYNRMGAMTEEQGEDTVEVWLAYGRDQSQVIRGLINNDFTPNYETPVNLKLVSGGTLLPSILSGMGPDVYIGLGQGDVINYAIRGALLPVDSELNEDGSVKRNEDGSIVPREDFNNAIVDPETGERIFNEAAMMVLGIENADGEYHYYGLPETQSFVMMFARKDILAELNIDIPETWDDVKEAIPVLQANNMQIGMHNDSNLFIYQSGGELFADGGMRINLDSNVALEAFTTMCDMFTMYSFPYKYDFANRFRTGEMPIGFAAYIGTYNQLKVFATEIEGLWGMYPMPGYADAETGEINNMAVSTVSAIVMITGCDNTDGAWDFMKWHAGAQCQIDYSNEMVAILGPSAKHGTANSIALDSLPWTQEELTQIKRQFNNLASIPNYPGSYIIGRYTQFAFLDAYDDNAEPATALQGYITTINKEITRKRSEFDLETLDYVGQTLAQKRMQQAEEELILIEESDSYSSAYDEIYENIFDLIEGYTTEDYASLRSLADALEDMNETLFGEPMGDGKSAVTYLREAADALESYEAYK